MKHKPVVIALITVLICMLVGMSIACTTPVIEHVLTISSTEGGQVTEPGEGNFRYCPEQGERVRLVATPDPGYRFVNWTGEVGTVDDVNSATTTITVNDDYSIRANFARAYSITISSTAGGSVTTPGEGTFVFNEGTAVRLVAEADSGYAFVKWTGDVGTIANVNAATTTIIVNGNYSIKANFVKLVKQFRLTISSTEGGSVTTPGEGTFTFDEGTVVKLVAVADTNYRFTNWTGDVSTIADVNAAITTITMNGDYAITANFYDPPCGCSP